MKKDLTEIAYVLDRSGSMSHLTEPAILSFNEFLKEQKEEPGEVTFSLVLFDNEYLLHAEAVPIREVVELDTTTYVPRASTALLDAIGRTIDDTGKRLAALKEKDRPGKVIVAIFTDGHENASTNYTLQDIAKRIKHQQEKYNWEFLFLGANQDAIATATSMNIHARNSSSFEHSGSGLRSSLTGSSRKVKAMRESMRGIVSEDLAAPMSDIVDEEMGKGKASKKPSKRSSKKS